MKILKIILFSLIGIMFAFVVSNLFFDASFSVDSSIKINSSPFVVYEQVENFEQWPNWDPWMAVDTTVTISLSDNVRDIGATRHWTSNNSGDGYLMLVSKEFIKQIDYEILIDNSSPFFTTFFFEADSAGVKLSWKHYGQLPFLSRVFGPFMQRMIKIDQTNGLENIKAYCESIPSTTSDISVELLPSKKIIAIEEYCSTNDIDDTLNEIYQTIFVVLAENGIMPTSSPFVQYIDFPKQAGDKNMVKLRGGIFIETPINTEGIGDNISYYESLPVQSVQATHLGDVRTINDTHSKIKQYCLENSYKVINLPYELFLTDPQLTPNTTHWKTKVIYQIE